MPRTTLFLFAACLAALPLFPAPPEVEPKVLAGRVDPARLKATVEKLASFGTRHTLSDATSPTRGIGAARRWLSSEFAAFAQLQGSRLQPFEQRFTAETGPRVPKPTEVVNVGALLPGTDPRREKERLVLVAHYDSRASDVLDATSDAPGAVDDASGVALVLELARVLAAERPAVGICFIAVAGEEQRLLGSVHAATRFRAEGVQILAALAADTIGNIQGMDGSRDDATARLFSEGVPGAETDAQRKLREALDSENDSPSREFARYLKRFGEPCASGLELRLMLRRDRLGRGGDHSAFTREGYPGVRLTEALENYDRQHQVPRTENGKRFGDTPDFFDAPYCARATRAVLGAFLRLSRAPAPPRDLSIGGGAGPVTRLRWTLPEDPRVAGLVLYRRKADALHWQQTQRLPKTHTLTLEGVVVDDWFFALATVDAEGNESLPVAPSKVE